MHNISYITYPELYTCRCPVLNDIMTHNVLFYENIAVAGTLLVASLPMFISMCTLHCRINGSVGNENSHNGVDSFCSCLVYSKR